MKEGRKGGIGVREGGIEEGREIWEEGGEGGIEEEDRKEGYMGTVGLLLHLFSTLSACCNLCLEQQI